MSQIRDDKTQADYGHLKPNLANQEKRKNMSFFDSAEWARFVSLQTSSSTCQIPNEIQIRLMEAYSLKQPITKELLDRIIEENKPSSSILGEN